MVIDRWEVKVVWWEVVMRGVGRDGELEGV